MYVNIKDQVVDFFHAQGITIVTIQPEFRTKSSADNKETESIVQCLISCQSLECAPKTCCSTTDLDAILIDGDKDRREKSKKPKPYHRKSNSMLSLNVSSLSKLRKFAGSTQDIMKKSVSESHVIALGSDDSIGSPATTANSSNAPSRSANLCAIDNSISELKENDDFHDGCDARSEQRLPPPDTHPQPRRIESISEHEDSRLLDTPVIQCNEMQSHEVAAVDHNETEPQIESKTN